MSTLHRVGREYAVQIIAFAIAIADRLLIPGILLRTLGVDAFSGWTVALAFASLLTMADLGAGRFFSNRTLALATEHRQGEAVATYRLAISIIALLSIAGVVLLLGWAWLVPLRAGSAEVDAQLALLLPPLIGVFAVQQIVGVRQMLYRAHQQFARETALRSSADLARIVALAIAALAGAELILLGWIWLVTTLLIIMTPVWMDTRRLFPAYHGWSAPASPAGLVSIVGAASGYWLLAMASTLFAAVPVLALGFVAGSAAIVVQFTLMRTIANLVRQILQMFANVFGLDLARRRVLRDDAGFGAVFGEATRLLGTQSAVVTVILMIVGNDLFTLWTGRSDLFDLTLLMLAIAPPILVPAMMLSAEALAYAERPWTVVRLRLVQAVLTLIAYVLLPLDHVGLRMMAALAFGEVFGFGLPLMFAVRRLSPALSLGAQGRAMAASYVAVLAAGLILAPEWLWPSGDLLARLTRAALLGGLALVLVVGFVGLGAVRRRQIVAAMRDRLGLGGGQTG